MPLFSSFIQKPIGNNMDNDPDDVLNTKRRFAQRGYYRDPIENGYIDRELDGAIKTFQRDNDLKADGIMNPGGETERTLQNTRPEVQKVAAAAVPPMAGMLGALLGISGMAALDWYNKQSPAKKNDVKNRLQSTTGGDPGGLDNNKDRCDDMYAEDTSKCNDVTRTAGKRAGAVCHDSAAERYASCLTDKPEDEWPRLQNRY